ncbi:MAG: type I methionyl aminopeptidase [Bifidobacteriaceae bacterium]|nr:type I methionyl aminopeptidase [Bifidobacteriaceae bacterium]
MSLLRPERIEFKSPAQIRRMRASGLVTAAALAAVREAVVPGATGAAIDALAEASIRAAGAEPNFLGYEGYPASLCFSVNDVVVHGIPGPQAIRPGDVVSIDCGAVLDGWHSDAAITVGAGELDARSETLIEVTRQALWDGIAAFANATHVGAIGAAIEARVRAAEPSFGILREYVGHGIGSAMHMRPDVVNFAARERGPRVRPGMVLAIEPMVVERKIATSTDTDGWTVRTVDGGRAAHWEHTVARTEGGVWVLTEPDGGEAELAARGIQIAPA